VQSFLSKTSSRTSNPKFKAERNFVIMRKAHVLHLLVHNLRGDFRVSSLKRKPVGMASIDLLSLFSDWSSPTVEATEVSLPLQDPRSAASVITKGESTSGSDTDNSEPDNIGCIKIIVEKASMQQLEVSFWNGLLSLADWDQSGTLDKMVREWSSKIFSFSQFFLLFVYFARLKQIRNFCFILLSPRCLLSLMRKSHSAHRCDLQLRVLVARRLHKS
jgi:hypothetical protein